MWVTRWLNILLTVVMWFDYELLVVWDVETRIVVSRWVLVSSVHRILDVFTSPSSPAFQAVVVRMKEQW